MIAKIEEASNILQVKIRRIYIKKNQRKTKTKTKKEKKFQRHKKVL